MLLVKRKGYVFAVKEATFKFSFISGGVRFK